MINYQSSGKRTAARLASGELKIDVLDCTLANGCVTPTLPGINWIPIKPATNSAFCAALVRKMIEDKTYDAAAISFTNQKAAIAGGYASYSNATFLVITDENHPNYRKLMRPADAGLNVPEKLDKDGKPVDQFVCINAETGELCDTDACSTGELEFEGEVNGVAVRTSFMILKDAIMEYTIEEYSEITGVSVADIERIAKEYTSHGPRVSVCHKGGSACGVNGTDSMIGANLLHAIVGANQMVGGNPPNSPGPSATGKGPRYDLSTIEGKPNVSKKNATDISRTGIAWEKTEEYKKRVEAGETDPKPTLPWYPLVGSSDSQLLASIVNQYPYQCKILVSWMCNTFQATPGSMKPEVMDKFKDPSILPLHIACDVFVGEHAQLADYIVPDTTPFESFGLPNIGTTFTGYGRTLRWPVKTPESIQLDDGRYASWEAFCVDVAKACGLPGWGDDAIPDMEGNTYPLNDASDLYMKVVANMAYADDEPVEDISSEEEHMQGLEDLPQGWKDAVKEEEWPKVETVLSRGGRYWPMEKVHPDPEGGRSYGYEKDFQAYFYSEARTTYKNAFTGEGVEPVLRWNPERASDMTPVEELFSRDEFPFGASEHKPRFRSVSMQSNSPIMRDICSHNYIEINDEDAAALGIKDGDKIRAVTPMGDVTEGEAMVRAGQVKGGIAVSFGYGHLAYGAQDIEIDGELTKGDPAIGAGTRLLTMLDPVLGQQGILQIYSDNEAASPGRSGGMFKIEKM